MGILATKRSSWYQALWGRLAVSWGAAPMEPHCRHLVWPLAQGHLLVVPYHWGLMFLEVCQFCPSLNEQCLSSVGRDVCHMLHGHILQSEIRQPETKDLDTESLAIGAQGIMLPRSSQDPSQPPECFLLHIIVEGLTLTDLTYHQKCLCPPFLSLTRQMPNLQYEKDLSLPV